MDNQTIVVKKIKKGGHGHHGGAWKVAFADFAVAMMAFFLLLWLIASTTKEEKAGLSEYFSPPTQGFADGSGVSKDIIDMGGGQKISQGDDSSENAREARAPNEAEIQQAVEMEKERLESLMEDLKKAIEASQALKPFKDQLLLDITAEGLRIQIVDKENRPMFDSGSAELKDYTKVILHELAKSINTVPNKVSLTGHTDATRFVGRKNYSNWELSADRANTSRRELITGGLKDGKIVKVMGLASTVLFNKAEPRSPINRRIAIIVMNKAAEEALLSPVQPVSDGEEARVLIEQGVGGATVQKPVEKIAREQDGKNEGQHAHDTEVAADAKAKHPLEPVPTETPAAELKATQDIPPPPVSEGHHEAGGEPAGKHAQGNKKTAKKRPPTAEPGEPDYTGMSIAERIKARREWNRQRSKAAKNR
ncbi:MAG: flagellar motor protein MotB [Gammaproteobacteria bacterium]|nr:flagellar motor protein MotB [Gammaproteobacteria bacterium]